MGSADRGYALCVAAAALLILFGAGCAERTPYASGNAPPYLRLAPVAPPESDFEELQAGHRRARGPEPQLPPPAAYGGGSHYEGVRPLTTPLARQGDPGTRPYESAFNPHGLMPLRQLVFGGANPEFGESREYRLAVRDKLRVTIADHPEFDAETAVDQDGAVRLPNTDLEIHIAGRTVPRAERIIADRLSAYIRGEVTVHISIILAHGGHYYVFGQIEEQGRFPMGVKPVRLSEAIFRASSEAGLNQSPDDRRESNVFEETVENMPRTGYRLSEYTNLSRVCVITPHRSRPVRKIYDVRSALLHGKTGQDPYLRSGQIVFVPNTIDKRFMKFLDRLVAPIESLRSAESRLNDASRHYFGTGN